MSGYFKDNISYKDRTVFSKIYVAQRGYNILGWRDQGLIGMVLRPGTDCPISLVGMIEHSNIDSILRIHKELFREKLGVVKNFEHKIVLKPDAVPVVHKVRNVPMSMRSKLKQHLDKLQSENIIEPIDSSQWVSPIVVALKKNDELRLCVDLRSLNRNILVDCFPLPKIQDLLAQLGGAKYFTSLDLRAAYHQVELTEDSKPLTAFNTPFGAYQYLRLPFGLASAASLFQKLMFKVLGSIQGVIAYQDDILVYSENIRMHLTILNQVLTALKEHGFTLKKRKM